MNSYCIIDSFSFAEDTVKASLRFDPGHALFSGHFPGQPVVPGVCMMDMVKKLSERALGVSLQLAEGQQVKFLQLLVPSLDTTVVAEIKLCWQQDAYLVQANFKKEEQAVLKLSGAFRERSLKNEIN